MSTVFPHLISGTARELLAAERLLLESRRGFRRATPYLILFLNLFANGYLHPLMREDLTGYVLALFFFLKSSVIAGLSLAHYLSVSETILRRIDHLPVTAASRFSFVVFGGLRTPGVSGLLATDVLFLLVIFGGAPAAAITAVCALGFLALDTIGVVSVAALLLRRSAYPVTALAALGALGFCALATGLIIFRTSGLLPLVPLVWLTQAAVDAALRGATDQALSSLGGLAVISGAILLLGRRLA